MIYFCNFTWSCNINFIININGTVITHKILFIAVKDIERAIFPFANDVKTLLVTPPGAAARIITPIANSGDKGQNITIINATIGRIIIWKNNPIRKSLGLKKTLVKSESDNPKPRENIINAKDKGKITSVTIPIKK